MEMILTPHAAILRGGALSRRIAVGPLRRQARPVRRTLADHIDFRLRGGDAERGLDPDCDVGSWPDTPDQSCLGAIMAGDDRYEDDEDDAADTGIEDGPHDACDEDGI